MSTTPSTTTTISVNGMTCDHCVQAVTKEVSAISNVEAVAIDLAAGQVVVTSLGTLDDAALAAAIDDAGFEVG